MDIHEPFKGKSGTTYRLIDKVTLGRSEQMDLATIQVLGQDSALNLIKGIRESIEDFNQYKIVEGSHKLMKILEGIHNLKEENGYVKRYCALIFNAKDEYEGHLKPDDIKNKLDDWELIDRDFFTNACLSFMSGSHKSETSTTKEGQA